MTKSEQTIAAIRERFVVLAPTMNEASRRRWLGAEAQTLGRGGLSLVAAATGISLPTIRKGVRELAAPPLLSGQRIRRPGGGRKPLLRRHSALLAELDALLDSSGCHSPLHWSAVTPVELQERLAARGQLLSRPALGNLLLLRGYRWVTAERRRPSVSPTEQQRRWRYLAARVMQFLRCGQPVLTLELPRGNRRSQPLTPASEATRELGPAQERLEIPSRLVSREIGLSTLSDAVLYGLLRSVQRELRQSPGELLLIVGAGRRRPTAVRWQRVCERLARELRRSVQIVLCPAGIYRWESLTLALSGRIAQQLDGEQQAASLELGWLTRHPSIDRELAARLHAGAYPQGLISLPDPAMERATWSFVAKPRHSDRAG